MRSLLAGVPVAILLLVGCDSPQRPPFAPDLIPGSSRASATSYTLSGVVTAAGVPVAGAVIEITGGLGAKSSISGGNGFYSIQDVSGSLEVRAAKDGYFSDSQWVYMAGDTQLDFRLQRAVGITVGEVVRGRVTREDPVCFPQWDSQAPCQRFLLTAPGDGTLDFVLTWAEPDDGVDRLDLVIVSPGGAWVAGVIGTSEERVSLRVTGGLTYEVRIIFDRRSWDAQDFELTTALR